MASDQNKTMDNFVHKQLFLDFQEHINKEMKLREEIREIVMGIEQIAKEAHILLQTIHTSIKKVPEACLGTRKQFEKCKEAYKKLAELIPAEQYYRYCDRWSFITQRVVFLIALTVYLESEALAPREECAEILGLKTSQGEGFHLEIEDYLMGILQMASELARFATNSVTLGDYNRPLSISRFVSDLNSGFRLLNLKNDSLRKRFDALKYDVKKIEEVVYDITIRGLRPQPQAEEA